MAANVNGAPRDLVNAIKRELERYPVKAEFGHGSKHPFVNIIAQSGQSRRVVFASSPRSEHRSILNVTRDVRHVMRELNVAPYPEKRREARVGTLGQMMQDVADRLRDAPGIEVLPDLPKPKHIPLAEPIDDDLEDFEPAYPELPLCPDAIREALPSQPVASVPAQPKEEAKPMLAKTETTPPPSAPRTNVKLLRSEAVKLMRLIVQNAEIDDAAHTIAYRAGWSDARLHEILIAEPGREKLRLITVQLWRRQAFGMTPEEKAKAEGSKPTPIAATEADNRRLIDQLVVELIGLKARLDIVEDAVTRPGA